MKRCHLFELEDQAWFPAPVRDLATDYLHFVSALMHLDRDILPLVAQALRDGGVTHIVDLCSGGSGPLPALVTELAAQGTPVHATLTDLYPNVQALASIAAASGGAITFLAESVDARAVPPSLSGLRTIFNGFHHLKPADAAAVLHAAAAARQPIAIFEISERSPKMILGMFLTPLAVWIATPFMRPFQWRRLLWTYLVPLVPLTCFWDGLVSQLRAYSPTELHQLCEHSAPMRWTIGQIPTSRGRGRVTYLVGIPA